MDTLEIFGTEYTGVTGIKATDDNGTIKTYVRPQGTKSISANGTGIDVTAYASVNVSVPSGTPSLQTKTKTYTPTTSQQTETITADSGYDGLSSVGVTVNAVPILSDYSSGVAHHFSTQNQQRKWNAFGYFDANETAFIPFETYDRVQTEVYTTNAIASGTTVTPTESTQTIGGAYYMMEGAVTVNAIPSNYIGSGVTQRSSSDLTASGATVTVPSGYYSSQATKSVSSGTAGTPTATKGTVSNHSISITPSVTNTTGYITGGTKNGTAVSVSASELVSGTLNITDNGTSDCTNYASVNVNLSFSTIYTGSSTPSSSTGSNGDIYLKVV